jgi:hypothetical protein
MLMSGIIERRRAPELRQRVREIGVKAFKEKVHPQMWRVTKQKGVGAKLGPMGQLGDDVIIEMLLTDVGQMYRDMASLNLYPLIFQTINKPLEAQVTNVITAYVPMDSGDLRKSMTASIWKAAPTAKEISQMTPYIMSLAADVPYASPVNQMPSSWLRHPGSHTPNARGAFIGKSGNTLNDPKATHNWFNLVRLRGRQVAQKLFQDFIKKDIAPHVAKTAASWAKGKDPNKQAFVKQNIDVKRPYLFAKRMFTVRFK